MAAFAANPAHLRAPMAVCWNDLSVEGPEVLLDRFAHAVLAPEGGPITLAALTGPCIEGARPVARADDHHLRRPLGSMRAWESCDVAHDMVGPAECGRAPGQLVYCFDTRQAPTEAWLLGVSALWPGLRFVLRYLSPECSLAGAITASGAHDPRVYRPTSMTEFAAFARDHFDFTGIRQRADDETNAHPPPARRALGACPRPSLRLIR